MKLRSLKIISLSLLLCIVALLINNSLFTTTAASKKLFDINFPGAYWGQSGYIEHKVLPPIYGYWRSNRPEHQHKVLYSADVYQLTGVGNSELHKIWGNNNYSVQVGSNGDVSEFIDNLETYERNIFSDIVGNSHFRYEDYVRTYKQLGWERVGEINRCAQMIEHPPTQKYTPAPMIRDATTFYKKREECKRWYQTGFKFVKYSLAGVPQSKAGDEAYFQKRYNQLKQNPNKYVSIQYMYEGGAIYYKWNYGKHGELPVEKRGKQAYYAPMNTAINNSRTDVHGFHPGQGGAAIGESTAIVVWDVSDVKNPKVDYVLRLACVNPLASATEEETAKVSVAVKGEKNPTHLVNFDSDKAKIKFTYELSKNIVGYAKHTMEYAFSSQPKNSLNPALTKVTEVNPAKIIQIGTPLPNNKKIDLDNGIPAAKLKYEEEVEISKANEGDGKIWKRVSPTEGVICRKIQVKPKPGQHTIPANLIKSMTQEANACVKIIIGGAATTSGGIFVDPMVPAIASVTDTIYPDYRGINSYAIRPKQWKYTADPISRSTECSFLENPSGAASAARTMVESACQDICQSNQENHINCRLINLSSSSGVCGYGSCQCSPDEDCCDAEEYYSGYASGICEYELRQSGAKTVITKIIYKPETVDLSAKSPMTLSGSKQDNDNEPCTHYLSKLGPEVKGAKCDTYRTSHAPFDNISLYSLSRRTGTPYGKMLTIISPIHGGLRGDAKATQGKGTGIVDALYDVEHLPSGSVVCFGASMYPWSKEFSKADRESGAKIEDKYRWAHSEPKCFTVSKKPFFSVENGMVVTSGGIVTNINRRWSDPNSKTVIFRAGSWAEYSAIANQQIANLFATNAYTSGRVRVTGGSSNTYQKWHRLTFANTPSYGHYAGDATGELTDPIAFFNNLPTGNYANTTIHRPGGNTIGGNLSGVYIYNGDTTITSDITAGSSGNSGAVGDLSQAVIVVNGNLTINSNVTHVDAWLLVSGTLYTSDRPVTESAISKQGIGDTENALVINGPVRANEIKLRRTAGSGFKSPMNSLGDLDKLNEQFRTPAETFRLTPDTYVWSYYNSLDKGKVQTVYLREVAPRY